MQEYFEQKQEDKRRIPAGRPVSDTITITVAEYHFLTKAATLLETILNAPQFNPVPVVDAVRDTVKEMQRMAEAGAEE